MFYPLPLFSLSCFPCSPHFHSNTSTTIASIYWIVSNLQLVAIEGTIPDSIGELTSLETLRLDIDVGALVRRETSMRTSIPDSLQNLPNLKELYLQLMDVTGVIPPRLGSSNLHRFVLISASSSQLLSISGVLPETILSGGSLHTLVLEQTSLTVITPYDGPLGQIVLLSNNPFLNFNLQRRHFSAIQTLSIRQCQGITGSVVINATQLQSLRIQSDSLTWSIAPDFWKEARNLEHLDVNMPLLSGSFWNGPRGDTSLVPELPRLQSIKIVSAPHFRGTIPSDLANRTSLQYLILDLTGVKGPLPSPFGSPNLVQLKISGASNLGLLPASIVTMPNLYTFVISTSGLNGTLPPWIETLTSTQLVLTGNQLEGSLPRARCELCRLNDNRFSGEIPFELAASANRLELQNNNLGPNIGPVDIFTHLLDGNNRTIPLELDLSHNSFRSPLPEVIDPGTLPDSYHRLLVSHNQFYGSIPKSWQHYSIDASHNNLSGSVSSFLLDCTGESIILNDNRFNGAIPAHSRSNRTIELRLDNNDLSGSLHMVWPSLALFSASGNRLSGIIGKTFIKSVISSNNLMILDLSRNQLTCFDSEPVSLMAYVGNLKSLNLANNAFSCIFSPQLDYEKRTSVSPLMTLDLSNNSFTGVFQPSRLDSLVVLNISHNKFSGIANLANTVLKAITQIDISFNQFQNDVSDFDDHPFLFSLNARNNALTGALKMENMPKLATIDLSSNALDVKPSLKNIGLHFSRFALKSLSIKNNPMMPRIDRFDTPDTGLNRSDLVFQAKFFEGVLCHSLTFFGLEGTTFEFDDGLFYFKQCDCDENHFGAPPGQCQICPSMVDADTGVVSGIEHCGGESLRLTSNSFLIETSGSGGNDQIPSDLKPLKFESETCLVLPEQILTQTSNCQGLTLTVEDMSNETFLTSRMSQQCSPGSSGRLCSRCLCDVTDIGSSCYYEKALRCTKCSRVLAPRQYFPMAGVFLVLLIILLSIIFLLVLRSKRVQRTVPWEKVRWTKRSFYRVLFLFSLGNISILIKFGQILLELTHWDAYALARALKLMNLNGDSLGLTCLFPFLSDPMIGLAVKLYLPILALLVVLLCIGLAELGSNFLARFSAYRLSSRAHPRSLHGHLHSPDTIDFDPSQGGWDTTDEDMGISSKTALIQNGWTSVDVHAEDGVYASRIVEYPTIALLTTVLISVVRFVYFSTALSAHEYLFSVYDTRTKHKYVQSYPYLRTDEAKTQIWMSVPIIILFDAVLPLGFILLCLFGRNKIKHPRTAPYFGSLFAQFTSQCYWWEIVIIFQKLSIALVLRGIPASNALQVTLIVTVLAGTQLLQVAMQPWRRKSENLLDSAGPLILIGALLAARSGHLYNSYPAVYYVIAVSFAYLTVSIIVIGYQAITGRTDYEKQLASLQSQDVTDSSMEEDEYKQIKQSALQSLSSYVTDGDGSENERDGS